MRKVVRSARGCENITPFNWKRRGKISIYGMKIRPCLERDSIAAFNAFPHDWKSKSEIVTNVTKGSVAQVARIIVEPILINSGSSLLNKVINCGAKIYPKIPNPVITINEVLKVNLKAFLTRSKSFAPKLYPHTG